MTLYRTFLNFRETPIVGEITTLPSQTQPDEVMTIRQMLERHVRGLPVKGETQAGQYYPPELGYIPSLDELDLAEIGDLRDRLTQRVKLLKEHQDSLKNPTPARSEASPQEERKPLGDNAGDVSSQST